MKSNNMEQEIENKQVKQVIVVRKDLNMRKGKLVAQGSHASLGALLKEFNKTQDETGVSYSCHFEKGSILDKWLNGIFTKICLYVESEDELVDLYNEIKLKSPQIPCVLIEDAGLTEFHGQTTKTCIGIGPYWSEDIDFFTNKLKLL